MSTNDIEIKSLTDLVTDNVTYWAVLDTEIKSLTDLMADNVTYWVVLDAEIKSLTDLVTDINVTYWAHSVNNRHSWAGNFASCFHHYCKHDYHPDVFPSDADSISTLNATYRSASLYPNQSIFALFLTSSEIKIFFVNTVFAYFKTL